MLNQQYRKHLRYFTIEDKNELYLQIFYHSIRNNQFFKVKQEFLYSNTKDKFSILFYINDEFKTPEDVFDFILEYPDTGEYGHFTQRINPINANYSDNIDVKIQPDTTWNNDITFVGLHQSEAPQYTYIEGVHSFSYVNNAPEWYYAVGAREKWHGIIPGYRYNTNKTEFYQVSLWIKLNDICLLNYIPMFQARSCNKKVYLSLCIQSIFAFLLAK